MKENTNKKEKENNASKFRFPQSHSELKEMQQVLQQSKTAQSVSSQRSPGPAQRISGPTGSSFTQQQNSRKADEMVSKG